MAAGQSVESILAGAKDTLNKASAMSDSAAKEADKIAPKPAPNMHSEPPKHEYSNAPYSMAHQAGDLGKELKATIGMRAKAQKALQ